MQLIAKGAPSEPFALVPHFIRSVHALLSQIIQYTKDEYQVLSWFLNLLFHDACTNTQSITSGT